MFFDPKFLTTKVVYGYLRAKIDGRFRYQELLRTWKNQGIPFIKESREQSGYCLYRLGALLFLFLEP